jgi:hypothetical protein
MKSDYHKVENHLWRYIFPALSIILWILTIVLFFKSNEAYSTNDFEAQWEIMNALRWHPACCIGAIISTAAAYVVSELQNLIDERNE